MLELTIKDTVYSFNFGLGFVREINKRMRRPVEGIPDAKQDVGLQFAIASVIDEDPVELVNILDIANKTEKPRVTRALLDSYIEDEDTDIEALFSEVLDFLSKANATKKVTAAVKEFAEEQKAKMEAEREETP